MKRNSEDTQIWILTAVQHTFSHEDSIELDYTDRTDRNRLEDIYLEMITPLMDGADGAISKGRHLMYQSGDEYIKQALGLTFPENGPGLLDCAEFLKPSKSIGVVLEDEFRKYGSVNKYPTVTKYIKFMNSMHMLYQLPDIIKVVFETLRSVNCKITLHEASHTPLKNFVSLSQIQLWNDLWWKVKKSARFIDNIHVPEQYMDMILTEDSNLTDFLPSINGPGVCSWFLINNLVVFYNHFAGGPLINIASLTKFVTPPSIPKYEVVAITYDAYDGARFDFKLLEESMIRLFNVRNRCRIDVKTVAHLLFNPLKSAESWHKILGQVKSAVVLSF